MKRQQRKVITQKRSCVEVGIKRVLIHIFYIAPNFNHNYYNFCDCDAKEKNQSRIKTRVKSESCLKYLLERASWNEVRK